MVQFLEVTKYLPSCLVVLCWIWRTWGFLFEDESILFGRYMVCIYNMNNCHSSKKRTATFRGIVDVHFVERRAVFQAMLFHVAVGIGILDE